MKKLILFILILSPVLGKSQCGGGSNQPFFDLPDFYCSYNGTLDLTEFIPDFAVGAGTFSGIGVSGTIYTPNVAFPNVSITYVDATNCIFTDVMTVVFNCCPISPTSVVFDLPIKYCLNEPLLDLTNYVSIQGGTFYGNGVTGNFFDPQAIQTTYPEPVFTITYEYYNSTDNCYEYIYDVIEVDQDCCNTPGSTQVVPSYGGTATGLGLMGFSNQDVTILGDFTIDVNFVISNSIVRLDDHVKIIVQPGVTLTINNNSDLFSCNQISWQGIVAIGANANVIVDGNSILQDAEAAIYASDNAEVKIANCTFNKNKIGVHIDYNSILTTTAYPFSVFGNVQFTCATSLNSPGSALDVNNSAKAKSFRHIEAIKANLLKVGLNIYQPNYFDNAEYGIYSENTALEIFNNSFTNINGYVQAPIGSTPIYVAIYGDNNKTSFHATIGNIVNGFFSNGNNVFINCTNGIFLLEYEKINIVNNFLDSPMPDPFPGAPFFRNGERAILTENAFIISDYSNIIESNYINGFDKPVIVTHLTTNIFNNTVLSISNNQIKRQTRPMKEAILLNSIVPSSLIGIGNDWKISNNDIKECDEGIRSSGIRGTDLVIDNNKIKMTNVSGVIIKSGIRLQNCYKTNIINNTISGEIGFPFSNRYKGIFNSFSNTSYISCNKINRLGQSMVFEGTTYSTITGNKMNRAYDGFVLLNNGEIGQQGDALNPTDNAWIGTFVNSQTLTNNTTTANTNSPLYLRPLGNFLPTDNEDFQQLGFEYTFGNGLYSAIGPMISCPALPRDIKVLEKMAQGNQNYQVFEPSSKWIAKHTVYNELLNDPTLRQQSTVLDSFYFASQTGCFDEVNKIIDAATNLDTSLLGTLTNNFNPNCDIEQNYKNFYGIMYNYWVNGIVNSNELSSIENIALQCPVLGGTVVYSARDFYNYLTISNTEFEDNCEEFISREYLDSLNSINIEFNIYPNPNNGEFKIRTNQNSGFVSVFDITGKCLFTQIVLNSEFTLKIPDVIPGLYIIEFSNGKVLNRTKFVIE